MTVSIADELHDLMARAAELQHSVDRWNRWYLITLGLAALVALAVGITNRFVIVRQRQLATVQDQLLRTKDEQMREEQAEKDRQLRRELDAKDAAVANNLKAKDVLIGAANAQIVEASNKVTELQRDAADAKAAQQSVEIELSKQQERAAIAEADLLKLQERLKPRHLTDDAKAQLAMFLRDRAKGAIRVEVADLPECRDFAQDIVAVLGAAGWTIERNATVIGGIPAGIHVAVAAERVDNPPDRARVLLVGLELIGTGAVGSNIVSQDKEVVVLTVGIKEE